MIKPLLSTGQKIRAIACVAGIIIFSVLYFSYLIVPSARKISAARQVLNEAERTAAKPTSSSAAASQAKKENSELKKRKREMEAEFAKEKNIPRLSQTISALERAHNVNLRNSAKYKQEQLEHFLKAEATLTAVGKYDDIKAFLAALAAKGCIIKTADMAAVSDSSSSVKLSVSLVYYRYNK